MKTTAQVALLTLLLGAAAARAAQVADRETPTAITAGSPQTPGASDDPNIDRAFLLPTAMTQPAGSATYNNYELLLHGFTYGITDRVQLTATVLAPIAETIPFVGLAAAKWQFLSTPRLHLAVQASAGLWRALTDGSATITTAGAGAFATACLSEDCASLVSASAIYQLGVSSSEGSAQALIYGGSIIAAVSSHAKLLFEVASATGRDSNSGFDSFPGALVSYGVRLHGTSFASDIGFIKPVLSGGDGGIILGLPFASVSYRWL
jgi:hypothetical protein